MFDRVRVGHVGSSFIANSFLSLSLLYDRELKTWTFYSLFVRRRRKERAKKLRKGRRMADIQRVLIPGIFRGKTWSSANLRDGNKVKARLPSLTFPQSGAKRRLPLSPPRRRNCIDRTLSPFLLSLSRRTSALPPPETRRKLLTMCSRIGRGNLSLSRATKNVTSVVNNHDGGRYGRTAYLRGEKASNRLL